MQPAGSTCSRQRALPCSGRTEAGTVNQPPCHLPLSQADSRALWLLITSNANSTLTVRTPVSGNKLPPGL